MDLAIFDSNKSIESFIEQCSIRLLPMEEAEFDKYISQLLNMHEYYKSNGMTLNIEEAIKKLKRGVILGV